MSLSKKQSVLKIQNSYSKLPFNLYSKVDPKPVKKPQIIIFNETLANELNLSSFLKNTDLIKKYLSGNKIPKG